MPHGSGPYFLPWHKVKFSARKNASEGYAYDCGLFHIVAIMDTTLLKSGKEGYALGCHALYGTGFQEPISLHGLKQASSPGPWGMGGTGPEKLPCPAPCPEGAFASLGGGQGRVMQSSSPSAVAMTQTYRATGSRPAGMAILESQPGALPSGRKKDTSSPCSRMGRARSSPKGSRSPAPLWVTTRRVTGGIGGAHSLADEGEGSHGGALLSLPGALPRPFCLQDTIFFIISCRASPCQKPKKNRAGAEKTPGLRPQSKKAPPPKRGRGF